MKKMLILIVIAMLAGPVFAEENVLIDFSMLKADIHVRITENDTDDKFNHNKQTVMDYSSVAGGSFTAQQKGFMKTSLAIENWEVLLASSSRFVENVALSYTREATSKGFFGQESIVMGLRIHFPVEPFNSWAIVKPPFDIPAFEPAADIADDGTITARADSDGITTKSRFEAQEEGQPAYGIIKNVGVIREIKVRVYGLNFPHGLSTILINSQGTQTNHFMGYLEFDGWGELVWRNPAYMQEVRNRELRLYPLYPFSTPYVKFGGFLIQRDAAKIGGDFVTYFKDVTIIYDLAVLDSNTDIDDEALWRIIQTRETARKVWEMERFGQNQVLRYIEQQKQATELPFKDPRRQEQNQ